MKVFIRGRSLYDINVELLNPYQWKTNYELVTVGTSLDLSYAQSCRKLCSYLGV
jgi:hypothetical protein